MIHAALYWWLQALRVAVHWRMCSVRRHVAVLVRITQSHCSSRRVLATVVGVGRAGLLGADERQSSTGSALSPRVPGQELVRGCLHVLALFTDIVQTLHVIRTDTISKTEVSCSGTSFSYVLTVL